MVSEEILVELKPIIAGLFEVQEGVIRKETTQDDLETWDSLGHLQLFMAIEEKFGVKFTMDEIPAMRSVGDIIDGIQKKRGS